MTPEVKYLGIRSLKLQLFPNLVLFSNIICILQQLKMFFFFKFQCGTSNDSYYAECVRHLNVRIGEHIGISALTEKQAKPNNSSVSDHSLFCNHSASYNNFCRTEREPVNNERSTIF